MHRRQRFPNVRLRDITEDNSTARHFRTERDGRRKRHRKESQEVRGKRQKQDRQRHQTFRQVETDTIHREHED